MRFDEEFENFFKFSFHRSIWTRMGILAETFGNFLFPSSIGDEMATWSAFYETLSPHLIATGRITPKTQKSPCHFWHRDLGQGIKNHRRKNPVVVIVMWLFCCPFEVDHRGQSLFRLSFCDFNNITLFCSCQYQVSFTSVSH